MDKIIAAARLSGVRDYALVLFLASTGCRVGGVAGLCIADLDLCSGRAVVTEKCNKTRTVFLSACAVAALRSWLAVRPDVSHNFVFTGRLGNALTVSGIEQVIGGLADKAGVVVKSNPHEWRHGFARSMQANGMPLGVLSQLLGHSRVDVTVSFYGTCTDDELGQAHERYLFMR
jgi:site-specific recombinase XerD